MAVRKVAPVVRLCMKIGSMLMCADNGKKMAMDYSSGWYIYSFFKGAGLDLTMNEDGITNACNWNAKQIKKVWGGGFAVVKLPSYTIAGDSVQMCSFSGYKLLGVNPSSENCYWAMKLAQRLSDEESCVLRVS